MQFRKIWWDGASVRLEWDEQLPGATDKHVYECAEAPTKAFRDALAAFGPFVVKLLGLPSEWSDCSVRSLSLKVEEKNARGLQVTMMRKIADAKNRPVIITTPYLSEAPEAYNGDGVGYLDDVTLALIEDAELAAALYIDGERGEQTQLPLGDSENSKTANERMAAAEVASTRKPKGKKKGKDFIPGVGDVVNADATEPLTDENIRQLLLSVERDVPIDAIAAWASTERDDAARWAMATQKLHTGQAKKADVPKEPECVKRCATLPLKVDEWTSEPPPVVGEEAVHAIQDAARG